MICPLLFLNSLISAWSGKLKAGRRQEHRNRFIVQS
jgi:hypothetical protein